MEEKTINELVKYLLDRQAEAFAKHLEIFGRYGTYEIQRMRFNLAFNAAIELMIKKGHIENQMTLKTATKFINNQIENNGHSQR